MRKFSLFALVSILSGFMLVACERSGGVRAGNDSEEYKPRPAPQADTNVAGTTTTGLMQEMKGELVRVDTASKTVVVRLENGMVQTFKFDDNTMVSGLDTAKSSGVRTLAGKEGSEVLVKWEERGGSKQATSIEVTQVSMSKNTRKAGKPIPRK